MIKSKSIFVSGKFKVIHTGHLRLLRLASELADELIVGLDIDGLSPEEIHWRLQAIGSLEIVSTVETYSNSLIPLLERIKPEIILKGKEFEGMKNAEEDYVRRSGASLIFSSGDSFFSEYDLLGENIESTSADSSKIKYQQDFLARNNLSVNNLIQGIIAFQNLKVLVVGDVIVDEYVNCHPLGISAEEPTLVVTPIDSKKFLGGAGIVAAHCQALGAEVALLTCLGDDVEGGWAEKKISDYGVKLISVKDNSRPTTFKQRFRAGTQSLLRLSHLRQEPLSEKLSKELFVKFSKENFIPDVILFSDFSYGLCNDYLVREVINYGKLFGSYFSADSQSSSQIGNLSKFFEMNLISATEREVRNEVRDFSSGLIVVSEKLKNNLKCETLIVKIGPDGIILHPDVTLDASNSTETIEALNSNPTDVSGAGDSLLAAATLARGVKLSELESAFVGSVAASIQVSRLGNKPISKNAIIDVLSKLLEG